MSNWPGSRAVRTCTECKQSKLRCDSRGRFPHPCSRCQARDLQCIVDPSFRRMPTRKRVEAMSKELNELRSQSLKPRATSADDSSHSLNITGASSWSMPADDFNLSVETVKIGCVVVSAETAIEVFKIFATLFHPRLPVLVPINISAIYHSSQLLFWTIIAIVASHTTVPSSEGLFDHIAGPFQDMVRTEALQAPLSLQNILALLLLCTWPMPVIIQAKDPSWIYSGVATNSALFLGLHRTSPQPPPYSKNDLSGNPLERIMAWLGCFYVSSCLSMNLSLRVMLDSSSELTRITAYLEDYPISREFASEIKLQTIIANFKNVLSHTANDGTTDPSILHLLDRELDGLKSSYPDQWPRMLEYNTLVAKLHMYGLVIARDEKGTTARDILLKLSFSTSLRIVHLANMGYSKDLPECHGLSASQKQCALPKAYYQGLCFTTIFLIRYFSLNTAASAEEQQLAANHVAISHSIFKSLPSPTDEYVRVSRIIEDLCQLGPVGMDSRAMPEDKPGVWALIKALKLASKKCGNNSTCDNASVATPAAESTSLGPSLSYTNQTLDPWVMDVFSDQYWCDPAWDPFAEAQFPLGQNG